MKFLNLKMTCNQARHMLVPCDSLTSPPSLVCAASPTTGSSGLSCRCKSASPAWLACRSEGPAPQASGQDDAGWPAIRAASRSPGPCCEGKRLKNHPGPERVDGRGEWLRPTVQARPVVNSDVTGKRYGRTLHHVWVCLIHPIPAHGARWCSVQIRVVTAVQFESVSGSDQGPTCGQILVRVRMDPSR